MIDTELLRLLADGHFHSGEKLGEVLRLSRTAVWNRIEELRQAGIVVDSVSGKGYRIAGGIDLLDAALIAACAGADTCAAIGDIAILPVTGSTNDLLMERIRNGDTRRCALFAEQQTAGRGRRGKVWVSPFAANLYLSVSREFPRGLAALDGLSLAVGVALCELIKELGVPAVGLKWPNDLVVEGRKLGGILIDVSAEAGGPCSVVIGIGLNVAMSMRNVAIDQPWTDLRALGVRNASRNQIAAQLLSHLAGALDDFSRSGLENFQERWRACDVVSGKKIDIHLGSGKVSGIAAGIDRQGALLVDTAEGRMTFHGGEVSVRSTS